MGILQRTFDAVSRGFRRVRSHNEPVVSAPATPPANWPFPTYKGKPIAQVAEDGPPMPKRRGPKPRVETHGEALL